MQTKRVNALTIDAKQASVKAKGGVKETTFIDVVVTTAAKSQTEIIEAVNDHYQHDQNLEVTERNLTVLMWAGQTNPVAVSHLLDILSSHFLANQDAFDRILNATVAKPKADDAKKTEQWHAIDFILQSLKRQDGRSQSRGVDKKKQCYINALLKMAQMMLWTEQGRTILRARFKRALRARDHVFVDLLVNELDGYLFTPKLVEYFLRLPNKTASEFLTRHKQNFVYHLLQGSGEQNAAGLLKFFAKNHFALNAMPKTVTFSNFSERSFSLLTALAKAHQADQWKEETAYQFGCRLMSQYVVSPHFVEDCQFLISGRAAEGLKLFDRLAKVNVNHKPEWLRIYCNNAIQVNSTSVKSFVPVSRLMYALICSDDSTIKYVLGQGDEMTKVMAEVVTCHFADNPFLPFPESRKNGKTSIAYAPLDFITALGKTGLVKALLKEQQAGKKQAVKRCKPKDNVVDFIIEQVTGTSLPLDDEKRVQASSLLDAYEAVLAEDQAVLLFSLSKLTDENLLFLDELFQGKNKFWNSIYDSLNQNEPFNLKQKIENARLPYLQPQTNLLSDAGDDVEDTKDEKSFALVPTATQMISRDDKSYSLDTLLENAKTCTGLINPSKTEALRMLAEMGKTIEGRANIEKRLSAAFKTPDAFFIALLAESASPAFFNPEMVSVFCQQDDKLQDAVFAKLDIQRLLYDMVACSNESNAKDLFNLIATVNLKPIQFAGEREPRSLLSALIEAYEKGQWQENNALQFALILVTRRSLGPENGDYSFLVQQKYLKGLAFLYKVIGPQACLRDESIHVDETLQLSHLVFALIHFPEMLPTLRQIGFKENEITYKVPQLIVVLSTTSLMRIGSTLPSPLPPLNDNKEEIVIRFTFFELAVKLGRIAEVRNALKEGIKNKNVISRMNHPKLDILLSVLKEKIPNSFADADTIAQTARLVSVYEHIMESRQEEVLCSVGKLTADNFAFLNEIFAENAFWQKMSALFKSANVFTPVATVDEKATAVTVSADVKEESLDSLLATYRANNCQNKDETRNAMVKLMVERSVRPTSSTYKALIAAGCVKSLELLIEVTGKVSAASEEKLMITHGFYERYGNDKTRPFRAKKTACVSPLMYTLMCGRIDMVEPLIRAGFDMTKTIRYQCAGFDRDLLSITFPDLNILGGLSYDVWDIAARFVTIDLIKNLIKIAVNNKIKIPQTCLGWQNDFTNFLNQSIMDSKAQIVSQKEAIPVANLISTCHFIQEKSQSNLLRHLLLLNEEDIGFLNEVFAQDEFWRSVYERYQMVRTNPYVIVKTETNVADEKGPAPVVDSKDDAVPTVIIESTTAAATATATAVPVSVETAQPVTDESKSLSDVSTTAAVGRALGSNKGGFVEFVDPNADAVDATTGAATDTVTAVTEEASASTMPVTIYATAAAEAAARQSLGERGRRRSSSPTSSSPRMFGPPSRRAWENVSTAAATTTQSAASISPGMTVVSDDY